jgi:hypothetical protein
LKGYLAFDERRPVGWVHAAPCLLIPNLQLDASLAIDDADRVAAANLKARLFDPEIHLDTPKVRVKETLLARFNARLERGDSTIVAPTVSGRTPGARGAQAHRQPESETPVATG